MQEKKVWGGGEGEAEFREEGKEGDKGVETVCVGCDVGEGEAGCGCRECT